MQSNNNASWRGITLKYQLLRIYSLKRLKGAWLYSSTEQAAPLTEVIHLSRLEKTSVPVRQNSPLHKPRAATDSPQGQHRGTPSRALDGHTPPAPSPAGDPPRLGHGASAAREQDWDPACAARSRRCTRNSAR